MLPATLLVWWQSDVYARVCMFVCELVQIASVKVQCCQQMAVGHLDSLLNRRVKLPTLINHCARTECAAKYLD